MPRLIILGAAAALPEPDRENTFMALEGSQAAVLIDCAGAPMQRLRRAQVDLARLDGLIVTHHHPDHVYGVPMLFLGLWLSGRKAPFHVFAPPRTLRAVKVIMNALEWEAWPGLFPVEFHEVPLTEGAPVLDWPDFRIIASPGVHMLPVISLRVEAKATGKVLAYCCDTEPAPALKALARQADILVHESAGPYPGHSSAAQAAALAADVGAKRLVLVHFKANGLEEEAALLQEAQALFGGPVELGREWAVYDF